MNSENEERVRSHERLLQFNGVPIVDLPRRAISAVPAGFLTIKEAAHQLALTIAKLDVPEAIDENLARTAIVMLGLRLAEGQLFTFVSSENSLLRVPIHAWSTCFDRAIIRAENDLGELALVVLSDSLCSMSFGDLDGLTPLIDAEQLLVLQSSLHPASSAVRTTHEQDGTPSPVAFPRQNEFDGQKYWSTSDAVNSAAKQRIVDRGGVPTERLLRAEIEAMASEDGKTIAPKSLATFRTESDFKIRSN